MAKQSLLADLHRRNHAVFTEQAGWLIVDHFGGPNTEYRAVYESVGLFDLAHRAMLQFTGPDRLSFLQGMLSNDLRQLEMFEGQQATLLTQQGKVVADVRVLCAMNSIYLDFWEPLKDKILTHLNRYLVADDVEVNDPNEQWKMLSVQGPLAKSLLVQSLTGAALPSQPNGHAMVQFDGAPLCVVRADHTGRDGFDVIVQSERLEPFARRLTELGGAWVGAAAQEILRIEAGIPRYGVDFDDDNLLLEVGLDNAVSFTKGCYLGQEIVERIRSRGHINRKLCGLVLASPAPAAHGDTLSCDGHDAGKITSSAASPALNRPIALGYVHKDYWTEGTRLSVHHAQEAVSATVVKLPFITPSRTP